MRRKQSPAQLANLKPAVKGQILNPTGRGGKEGKGGFSLKTLLKNTLAKMEPSEREVFLAGILQKAAMGDVPAFKLVLEMNDELTQVVAEDNGVRISIQMPAMETSADET